MKTQDTVYVVTAVYNNLKDTKLFLKCLYKSDHPNIKTIIVDNGSTDGTREFIETKYPDITLIKTTNKVWWTGSIKIAVELVLRRAKISDFVVTLNDDCIFGKHFISGLTQVQKKDKKSIVGSLVLDSKTKRVLDAGVKINWAKASFTPIKIGTTKSSERIVNVDVLSTRGAIFPVRVFKKIGNFDDKKFPHYLSDYEYAYRLRKNGYRLYMQYHWTILNDGNRTGLGGVAKKTLSIPELFRYLFSRKSKINIFDQFKFFYYNCPAEYKAQCFWSLFKKAVYLFSFLWPISIVKKIFIKNEKSKKTK